MTPKSEPARGFGENLIGRGEVGFGLGAEHFIPHAGFHSPEAACAPQGEDHAMDGGVFRRVGGLEGGEVFLKEFIELFLGFAGEEAVGEFAAAAAVA